MAPYESMKEVMMDRSPIPPPPPKPASGVEPTPVPSSVPPRPETTEPFTPSAEWQKVPAGVTVPAGSEIRVDFKSQETYARWPIPRPAPPPVTAPVQPPAGYEDIFPLADDKEFSSMTPREYVAATDFEGTPEQHKAAIERAVTAGVRPETFTDEPMRAQFEANLEHFGIALPSAPVASVVAPGQPTLPTKESAPPVKPAHVGKQAPAGLTATSDADLQTEIVARRTYVGLLRLAVISALCVIGALWWWHSTTQETLRAQAEAAWYSEIRKRVVDLAQHYKAERYWYNAIPKNNPYSIEVERALIPGDGRPILFIGTVSDIYQSQGQTWVVLENASPITAPLYSPTLRFTLGCSKTILSSLLSEKDHNSQLYLVVAQIQSVYKPLDEFISMAKGTCLDVRLLPEKSGYHLLPDDFSPSDASR